MKTSAYIIFHKISYHRQFVHHHAYVLTSFQTRVDAWNVLLSVAANAFTAPKKGKKGVTPKPKTQETAQPAPPHPAHPAQMTHSGLFILPNVRENY